MRPRESNSPCGNTVEMGRLAIVSRRNGGRLHRIGEEDEDVRLVIVCVGHRWSVSG